MSGRCSSTPCHCNNIPSSVRKCSQCSRCLVCSSVHYPNCPLCPSDHVNSRPISPGPSTSRSCPPIYSPSGSERFVPVSPGNYRLASSSLSSATSLARWNSSKDLWIGEETRRKLPPHVYKYYWQRTMCYRRQSLTKQLSP